mgnify:CR=1 FL=1
MNNDLQIIEDYLPIWAIGAEASLEETVREGHISMLHFCRARLPIVICRMAVYGARVLRAHQKNESLKK